MRRASVGAKLALTSCRWWPGYASWTPVVRSEADGVPAQDGAHLVLAEPLRRRRDVVEAELARGERPGRVVGGERQQAAQEGRRRDDLELLARGQPGDVVLHDVGARLVDGAPVVVDEAGGRGRDRLGGGDRGGGVGVAGRRRDALHRRPRLVEHLAAVGGERLGRLVEDVLPAQHVREHGLAGGALADGGGRELVAQVVAVRRERRDGRRRRLVHGARRGRPRPRTPRAVGPTRSSSPSA